MLPRATIPAGPIVLREPVPEDAEARVRACADPLIVRFRPRIPAPYTREDAPAHITETAPGFWSGGGASFAIADAASGAWLGDCSLKPPDSRGAEIGYLVAPWARGRGVASAAVRALAEWAFAQGLHRVSIFAEVENPASQRVAMAAGFRHEGLLKDASPLRDGRYADLVAFARLAGDPGEPQRSYLPDLPGGELTDGVVRLAPLTMDDVDAYQEMAAEPDSYVHSVPPEPPPREHTEHRCRYTATWWRASGPS
ncbi:hypothetical protein Ssi03_00200 [Sphaerisporangium siamense]|uniref:RimJ/RimL family protein N-acetyltransferase n=1 Tax=Sphaerisporangium siamense TaxID=795645 RepID=A0A7W7DB21_9ACTN|nr:GNAT family N-acetyltransferase [Sphaerisporangium siamense]MBB4703559.1 RimJ/RimL family protein N-acetyltransferase [Sphaerisporangium siamense]GII82030.1 hypothetical protein Ssi03_00200 [Sphaerisporangium siamense]